MSASAVQAAARVWRDRAPELVGRSLKVGCVSGTVSKYDDTTKMFRVNLDDGDSAQMTLGNVLQVLTSKVSLWMPASQLRLAKPASARLTKSAKAADAAAAKAARAADAARVKAAAAEAKALEAQQRALTVGDSVDAKWKGTSKIYSGMIERVNDDGSLKIKCAAPLPPAFPARASPWLRRSRFGPRTPLLVPSAEGEAAANGPSTRYPPAAGTLTATSRTAWRAVTCARSRRDAGAGRGLPLAWRRPRRRLRP